MYCFGDPAKMSDENVRLSLRIHDEVSHCRTFGPLVLTCISATVAMCSGLTFARAVHT